MFSDISLLQLFANDEKDKLSLYRRVLNERQRLYLDALASGRCTPWIFPWDFLPAIFLVLGILVSPRLGRVDRLSRYVLFSINVSYCASRGPYARTLGLASGYGIGLAGQLGIIIGFTLLILHNPQNDFKRLEIRPVETKSSDEQTRITSRSYLPNKSIDLRQRKVHGINQKASEPPSETDDTPGTQPYKFVWQEYPHEFWHLMDWTLDLVTSFRGLNWNYRNHNLPGPDVPLPVEKGIASDSRGNASKDLRPTAVPQRTLRQLCKQACWDYLFFYVYLDFAKTIMVTDPYFVGIAPLSSPSPWHWLAATNDRFSGATRFVRLILSLSAVISALSFIFSWGPLFFGVILPFVCGDQLCKLTKSPLVEPWMYPPQFGPMFRILCSDGLAGMWGQWWHQLFRYGVSEPSQVLLKRWKIDRKSHSGRTIQLFIAFALSGSIHAVGGWTTFALGRSKPLMPMLFFVSQAVGILLQTALVKWIRKTWCKTPDAVDKTANLLFVVVWLWLTGPLLADDFARSGIWLFEPVPFSFFRGIGLGPNDGWFPWLNTPPGGKYVGWWSGDTWYRTGIAIF